MQKEENSPVGPEIETYKALLKVTARHNKKSPMRQHQKSKASLADYKELVDIHYRDMRRKDKHLDSPPTTIRCQSRPRDEESRLK